jgi:hypothetical protein
MRNISDRVVEKIETHIWCSAKFFPPPESRAAFEMKWKNVPEPGRPLVKIQDNAAQYAGQLRQAHRHSHRIFHISRCSTVTTVTPTRLNVTLHVRGLSVCLSVRLFTLKNVHVILHRQLHHYKAHYTCAD